MSRPTLIERVQQTQRLLRSEGYAGLIDRLLARASRVAVPLNNARLLVTREDMVRAAEIASSGWRLPSPLPLGEGEPLTVAWSCIPPGGGAGGAMTMFRLISSLEQAGNRCVVYLHDRHGWSLEQHERTIREWWPAVKADIRDGRQGIEDAHAIFATSWPTAYPVLTSPARGARMYLVQDLEHMFYAAGSEALLAEATYRFGFYGLTAGRWLAGELEQRYGMSADSFDFGCDLESYRLENDGERRGVCLYLRPSAPRRASELGLMALDLFAERHPDVDVHVYGEQVRRLPLAASNHGRLSVSELNDLYNRCVAGLALSATNCSLVPYEMLAAGCIPVMNDAEHNRVVLDNEEVVYAPATPFDLANALSALVERPVSERYAAAQAAAASVQGRSWEDAGAAVERVIRTAVQQASERAAAEPSHGG
jgi:glycosyltransferase involved in cell wall biosynthesis